MPIIRPIIREHHLREDAAIRYVPSDEWPSDCVVQWGGVGIVLGRAPYVTAFFEAFPADPSTFIRGEGETIATAETDALAQWKRIMDCPAHRFERKRYRNGGGVCGTCGLFDSKAFEPLPEIPHEQGWLRRSYEAMKDLYGEEE